MDSSRWSFPPITPDLASTVPTQRAPIDDAVAGGESTTTARGKTWTFLSSHAQVLLCIGREPDLRMREIAAHLGITERSVQLIVKDLVDAGFVSRSREGRCNRYAIHADRQMRHPLVNHREIQSLLDLVGSE